MHVCQSILLYVNIFYLVTVNYSKKSGLFKEQNAGFSA